MRWVLIVLVSGCVNQDPWTTGDTVLEGIAIATMIADAHMTTQIQYHPNLEEIGRLPRHFLGANPETDETWLYFATWGVTHYLISRALPKGWRSAWQWYTIIETTASINNAHNMGVYGEPCTRHQDIHPCE